MSKMFIFCCLMGCLVACSTSNQQSLNQSKLKNVIEKQVSETIRVSVKDGQNRERKIDVKIKPERDAVKVLKEEDVVALINKTSDHIGTFLIDKTAYIPASSEIKLYDDFLVVFISYSTVDYAKNRVTNSYSMRLPY
ncbi:hypothetical protein KTJ32_03265 [Acinetobacter gyllenbergii]|uniref:hypothetical protein n=1 Tax=Acinetobacter gyllenbergii TaxID=134534 RepID=UPI0021CFD88B|nr:hypothetical protein [Acinetobacter gyllenbergii]MCU4580023.1 hypothetical protein [Acinetobacter gyllenbergii]